MLISVYPRMFEHADGSLDVERVDVSVCHSPKEGSRED